MTLLQGLHKRETTPMCYKLKCWDFIMFFFHLHLQWKPWLRLSPKQWLFFIKESYCSSWRALSLQFKTSMISSLWKPHGPLGKSGRLVKNQTGLVKTQQAQTSVGDRQSSCYIKEMPKIAPMVFICRGSCCQNNGAKHGPFPPDKVGSHTQPNP